MATVDENGQVTAIAAGTATITAIANGDLSKQGTCAVQVTSFNKTLNGFVWDEEGAVWASSFNANNLPTWTKSKNTALGVYLQNALMADTRNLYASTCDVSDTSVIYKVNRTTYALTEYGTNFVPAFGMAPVGTGFGSGYFVYGFAMYLIFGNLTPKADDELGTYSGFPYGLLDLRDTAVGDAYVAAVCARSRSTTSATYYFLDETGKIWQVSQDYNNEDGITFGEPTLVVDTGIGTSFMYQSIYYDGSRIYWAHTTGEDCELIIYVPSTGKIYNAGSFGEGVWPVAGLYVSGKVAPASVGDEPMLEDLQLQPLATRDELMSEDVIRMMVYEASLWGIDLSYMLTEGEFVPDEDETPLQEDNGTISLVPAEEPAPEEGNAYLGSLTAFRGVRYASPAIQVSDRQAAGETKPAEDGETFTVEISETEDSHNGLIALRYNPEILTLVSAEPSAQISNTSVNKDTEEGVITFAYANKDDSGDDIAAGTTLLTVTFTLGQEGDTLKLTTLERSGELELNKISEIPVPARYLPGDVNGDGLVDNRDVTRLIRKIGYGSVFTVARAEDVNGDGTVNYQDVTQLARYIKYGDVEIH